MATPMEYDTLREIYSSVMSILTRLELKYNVDGEQFKEAENNFVQVWLTDVKNKDLEEINYDEASVKMKEAAKPWMDMANDLSLLNG